MRLKKLPERDGGAESMMWHLRRCCAIQKTPHLKGRESTKVSSLAILSEDFVGSRQTRQTEQHAAGDGDPDREVHFPLCRQPTADLQSVGGEQIGGGKPGQPGPGGALPGKQQSRQ